MNFFNQLTFTPLSFFYSGIKERAWHTFENGYEVSVITEPTNSSEYELAIKYDDKIVYDVMINGEVCDDTFRCLTAEDVDCIMKQVSELESRDSFESDLSVADQLLSGLQ